MGTRPEFVLLLFLAGIIFSQAYRLNVPRVLLPYHPNVRVKFDLVVSDPEGGCFVWRSTRPDIVSVRVVEPHGPNGCSDRAQIASTSKHVDEQTAVIFAEDSVAHVVLSCGVSVDVIRSISISTTTKVLFLDAAPAEMVVYAANSEGDMFSNLGEIPFEWRISAVASAERPLRIIPFSQSKYEAPEEVRTLEESRKRGFVVLVEGVSTGAANLKVSLAEPFFEHIAAREIDLLVVANLVMVPSQDLYIPLGSAVRYSAEIIKQSSHLPVALPSKQYRLVVSDESVCSLDTESSLVTAIALGSTQISIIDENLKAKHVVKPPSAHIYVVSPSSLSFAISGDSWYLQKGRHYVIGVQLIDSDDNVMLIPDNARFETSIPEEYFSVVYRSSNNTFFYVKAVKNGVATLKSAFSSIIDAHGEGVRVRSTVSGEAMATISEVLTLSPHLVVFPYGNFTTQHSWRLNAEGGTGVYTWSSEDSRIAGVDQLGVLTGKEVGETVVTVSDANNPFHSDSAIVRILPPVKLTFSRSPLEAEVGETLELSVGLFVEWKDELIAVTDCRHVEFAFSVVDDAVFTIINDHVPQASLYGGGCSSVMLKAIADGDTKVAVSLDSFSADVRVSAYPPLKLESPSMALIALGSEFEVRTSGGPRPWVVDPSGYFSKLSYNESTHLLTRRYERKHVLSCGHSKGDMLISVQVGNEATDSNPVPAIAFANLRVCCAIPTSMSISFARDSKPSLPPCTVSSHALLESERSKLVLSAFGRCESGVMSASERRFDSISALVVVFSTDEPKLLVVEKTNTKESDVSEIFAVAVPQGRSGAIEIVAKAEKYLVGNDEADLPSALWTSVNANIVEMARAYPSEVLLWNEKTALKEVTILSGSGQFFIEDDFDEAVIDAHLDNDILRIRPVDMGSTRIPIVDVCFGNRFEVAVTVTDLHQIIIDAPNFVGVNEEVSLRLLVRNANGVAFSAEDVTAMKIEIDTDSSTLVTITSEDPLNYRVQGVAVGAITLSASAKSASGDELRSLPHQLQVFGPLQLLPKVATLIPESVFQLEVIGGPQPTPPLTFNLNDSSVASVAGNGLIRSAKLGTATITGTIDVGYAASSKAATSSELNVVHRCSTGCAQPHLEASVLVRVVSLRGIRIRVSSDRLEQGSLAWARFDGLSDDETPFAFGGAKYPLRVVWTLHTPAILEIVSPFGPSVSESADNQFQVFLRAVKPGQAQLHVSVHAHAKAKAQFVYGRVFESKVTITVVEPIQLLRPALRPHCIRITPSAQFQLKPNGADGTISLRVPQQYSSKISIGGDGDTVLKAAAVGDAVLELRHTSIAHNESTFIPVSVLPVHSIHLDPQTALPIAENNGVVVDSLPLGYRIALAISFRDHIGRVFDATNIEVEFRPHRFDRTRITANDDKRLLNVDLVKPGETVLKVWDKHQPSVNTFIRLPVRNMILPSVSKFSVGDIICFKCLLACDAWGESAARSHFHFIAEHSGIAVAVEQGDAIVLAQVDTDQSIFTQVTIEPVDVIRFEHVPPFVSNIAHRRFVFPLKIGSTADSTNVHGCDQVDVQKLDGMRAPFECMVAFEDDAVIAATSLFVANALFESSSASYACVIQESGLGSSRALIENDTLNIIVSARWTGSAKMWKASTESTFYARFEVDHSEIHLNNVNSQKALITVYAPVSTIAYIKLEGCPADVIIIGKPKYITPRSTQYSIKLNVKSAFLWLEHLKGCNLTVSNELTGQEHSVAVIITLHGDVSKAVLHASEGILSYLTGLAGYSMMLIGTAVVTLSCIAFILAYQKGYRLLPYLVGDTYAAQPNVRGAFASDRFAPTPEYAGWRSMTCHAVPSPTSTSKSFTDSPHSLRRSFPNVGSVRTPLTHSGGSRGDTLLWRAKGSLNRPNAVHDLSY